MTFSRLALFLELIQLLLIGVGFFISSLALLYYLLVDIPPLYLIVLLVQDAAHLPVAAKFFYGTLAFHVVKYFMFARIKLSDEEMTLSTVLAVILEIAYLLLTSYLFYQQLKQ